MIVRVRHRTEYRYPGPVHNSLNEVRMTPLDDDTQRCIESHVFVRPEVPVYSYVHRGGTVCHFNIRAPHRSLRIEAVSLVETCVVDPFARLDLVTHPEEDWAFYEDRGIRSDNAEWLQPTRAASFHPLLANLAGDCRKRTTYEFLSDLNAAVRGLIAYAPGTTHVHTTIEEVLRDRAGVCQDYAHVMLAAARMFGIPARYVSGYLFTRKGEEALRGELSTHAWVECLLPDDRWHGFDPTNNLLANDHYVKVHFGRDYHDVPPTKGVYTGPPAESLKVSVQIEEVGTREASLCEV